MPALNRRPINFRRSAYTPTSAMMGRPLGAGGQQAAQAPFMQQAAQALPQPYTPQTAASAAVSAQPTPQDQPPLQAQPQQAVQSNQGMLGGGIGQLPQSPVPQPPMAQPQMQAQPQQAPFDQAMLRGSPAPAMPQPLMPQPLMPQPPMPQFSSPPQAMPPMPPAFDQQQLQSSLGGSPAQALGTGLSNNPYMANLGSFPGANNLSPNPYMSNLGGFQGAPAEQVQPPAFNQQQLQAALSSAPTQGMLGTGISGNPYMANLGSFPGAGSVQPPTPMNAPLPTTPQGKADYYNSLARQGMSDSQIRSQAESAFGQQTDDDWGYLQNLAGVKTGPQAMANLAQAPQPQGTQPPVFDQATLRNNLGGAGSGQPLQQYPTVAPPTTVSNFNGGMGTFAQPAQAAAAQAQPAQNNFAQPTQNKPAGGAGLM